MRKSSMLGISALVMCVLVLAGCDALFDPPHREARQVDAQAQYELALMYLEGDGVEQIDAEALKRLHLAAEQQGHPHLQVALGFLHEYGHGVVQDKTEAVRWYRLAAEHGIAEAQNRLGWMYERGRGIAQDYAEAVHWYRLAAEQDHVEAQLGLVVHYSSGNGGLPVDNVQALRWLRSAAELGSAVAQVTLAESYKKGQLGLTTDYAQALRWFKLAAQQGGHNGSLAENKIKEIEQRIAQQTENARVIRDEMRFNASAFVAWGLTRGMDLQDANARNLIARAWGLARKYPNAEQLEITVILVGQDRFGAPTSEQLGVFRLNAQELREVRRYRTDIDIMSDTQRGWYFSAYRLMPR